MFHLKNSAFTRASHALGLVVLFAALYAVVSYSPQAESIWIELSRDAGPAPRASIHFMQAQQTKVMSRGNLHSHNGIDKIGFFIPPDLSYEHILIDLEVDPSTTQVQRLYGRAPMFMFRLDSASWTGFERDLFEPETSERSEASPLETTKSKQQNRTSQRIKVNAIPNGWDNAAELVVVKAVLLCGLIWAYLIFASGYLLTLFNTRRRDAERITLDFNTIRESRGAEKLVGSILLLTLMIFLGFEIILQPGLFNEDSMEFTDLLEGRLDPLNADTYFYYRGYPVLLTKWMVYLGSWLPLFIQPLLYVALGLIMMWAALKTMAYSGVFRNPAVLIAAPTLLFVGSMNVPAMFLSLTGVFFSSTALMVALVIRPAPQSISRFFVFLLGLGVLSWSGPYAPQIVPAALVLLLLMSALKKDGMLLTLILSALVYTSFSASGMVQINHIFELDIRTDFYDAFITKVMLLGLIDSIGLIPSLGLVVLCLMVLTLFRNDRVFIKTSLVFLAGALASLATYFVSFKYRQYGGELISAHLVIPQFFWMSFLTLCLDRGVSACQNRWASSTRAAESRPTSPMSKSLSFILVMLITGALYDMRSNNTLPADRIGPDDDLHLFIEAVEHAKQLTLADNEYIQLWDTNSQAYVTSFRLGSKDLDAVNVSLDRIPAHLHDFALPVDLNRAGKTMLQFHFQSNGMWYSDQKSLSLPDNATTYQRERFTE